MVKRRLAFLFTTILVLGWINCAWAVDGDPMIEPTADYVAGTSNNITVTDDGDGTITLETVVDTIPVDGRTNTPISSDWAKEHIVTINEPTGVHDQTETTLSFVDGTRTFTITPTGATYDYWEEGLKYTVTGADSIILSADKGVHAIYYDGGVLTEAVNPSHNAYDNVMVNKPIFGIVYWNGTSTVIVANERHGTIMSGETHHWLHDNIGARYKDGLTASGYILNTRSDVALTFEVADGEFYDEDIEIAIENGDPAIQYEQILNGVDAEIPVMYRDDTDGTWQEQAASTLPYISAVAGSNRLAYNNDDGDGTWSQVEVGANDYMLYWLVATNDWKYPVKMIQGNSEYNTKSDALEGSTAELIAWGDFPSPEIVILYQFIMQTGNYAGTKKAQIVEVVDFRFSGLTGASASSQSHGSLSGLSNDDHAQYALLAGRTGGQELTGSDTTAETLILTDNTVDNNSVTVGPTFGLGSLDLSSQAAGHDGFTDFVANEHVDHTSVTLTAGTGLTGGGDISANRTFNVDVGIADGKILQVDDATAADNEMARFSYIGIEGITYSQTRTALSLVPGNDIMAYDAGLQSIAGVSETNGGMLYGTAADTYAWLAAGATTEILVGGGAAAPVWTTATGTGAPVRAGSPTFTTQITTPIIDLTGGQIAFPAVQSASSNANTLDDYEENLYNPTLTCSTSGSYVFAGPSDTLIYRKIGDLVYVQGYLNVTSESSPNGTLRLSVPFTTATLTDGADTYFGQNLILRNHGDAGIENPLINLVPGVDYVQFYNITDTGVLEAITQARVDTAFQIYVSFQYIAAN